MDTYSINHRFHATYCKICQRVILKFKKLAKSYHTRLQNQVNDDGESSNDKIISFAEVEVSSNDSLAKTLGILKTPYLQIYRNSECVASFATGPAHAFQRVVGETIQSKWNMSNEEWENFRNEYQKEITNGLMQLDQLKQEQQQQRQQQQQKYNTVVKIENNQVKIHQQPLTSTPHP